MGATRHTVLVLLVLSFACQAAGAALALRRARRGPGRMAWRALAAALALLAIRSVLALRRESSSAAAPAAAAVELLVLAASLALAGGLAALGRGRGSVAHDPSPGAERLGQEFLALAEHTPDLVTRHDRKGRIVYCNPAVADLLRRPREEVLGRTPPQLTPGTEAARLWQDAVMEVVQGGKPVELELAHAAVAGAPAPVHHVRLVPEIHDGRLATVLAIGRDITALEDAELRWRTLVENDPDLVARFDLAGRHVYVNPAVLRAGGFSPEEILGKTHLELEGRATPEVCRSLSEAVRGTIADGAPRSLEIALPVPGGEVDFDFRFLPERGPSGEVISVLCVGRDITARREAERRLRVSEERVRLALEAARVATWDWDVEHDRWYPSPSYYANLGYPPREGPGDRQEWLARVHPEDRAEVDERIRAVLAEGLAEHRYEARLLQADGSYRWQLVRGYSTERDAAGKVTRILGVRVDIDERKKVEEELALHREHLAELVSQRTGALEAANRDLEAFSYSVSHDLRAPLRAIHGFTGLLVEAHAAGLSEEGRRLLDRTRESALRMAQLVDDLLDFARMGRQELRPDDVDMRRLAEEAWAELEPARAGREIRFELGPIPRARGDAALLRQVWLNLLANAVKFTRPRAVAHVAVGGTREGGVCTYSVTDDGVGFDPAYGHKLFGVFQRLHRAEEFEGTGIGLALVHRIVARHGGRITAEGRVGAGTTVLLTLSAARAG